MIISQKKYQEDIVRAREEGRQSVFREQEEQNRYAYIFKQLEALGKQVALLEKEGGCKECAGTIPAVDQKTGCPPDRLDF